MNNEAPSPAQSLQIIQAMIDKTKESLRDNAFYFLLWGWLVFFAAMAQFALIEFTSFKQSYLVWNTMWIGAIITIIYSIRKGKTERVTSYLAETMKYFGISLGILYSSLALIFGHYGLWKFAFPVYILIYAFACFFMGSVMRFRLLQIGGLACLPLMAASIYVTFQWQLLLLAAAVLISYIIPGHLLKKQPD